MKKLSLLLLISLLSFSCKKNAVPLHTPYAGLFSPKPKQQTLSDPAVIANTANHVVLHTAFLMIPVHTCSFGFKNKTDTYLTAPIAAEMLN